MVNDWEPKEEHQPIISRSLEFIFDELAELQEALHCPNSFIVEIANKVISVSYTHLTLPTSDLV